MPEETSLNIPAVRGSRPLPPSGPVVARYIFGQNSASQTSVAAVSRYIITCRNVPNVIVIIVITIIPEICIILDFQHLKIHQLFKYTFALQQFRQIRKPNGWLFPFILTSLDIGYNDEFGCITSTESQWHSYAQGGPSGQLPVLHFPSSRASYVKLGPGTTRDADW